MLIGSIRLLKYERSSSSNNGYDFGFVEYDPRRGRLPYAVLSHRWGEDEVAYQEILDGTAKRKVNGYKKLTFCAAKAARDGLMYFWVDTCCIDKADYTELSFAINSMYEWYEKAARCYVYLDDVSFQSGWETTFQYSKWFARGWTLQELIAPQAVDFYSMEGIKLGDKKSLKTQISQCTRISIEALQGKPLLEIDPEVRLSWAAHRQTTVEEDAAYCLLGIFGVFMPLIYGEGRENALRRLEEEISKKYQPYMARNAAECLQTFKNSRYEQHKSIIRDRAEGTCRWVLEHPYYNRWNESAHRDLLWISADPGCGKSVLSKFLVDHELKTSPRRTTCYYFFKDNGQQDRLAPALCAVLHQLFSDQPYLLKYALHYWTANGRQIQEEVGMMWQILIDATSDKSAKPVICILDALDECCDRDREDLMNKFYCFHEQSQKAARHTRLKFLLTSRPYVSVQHGFQRITERFPELRLCGEAENDHIRSEIDQVIDQHIESLASEFKLSKQHQNRLQQRLREMKHRTYLWLYLAVDEIRIRYRDSSDPGAESIGELPLSVENAYERILQRITDRQKQQARRILTLIVGARRPLTVSEASLAVNAARAYEKGESIVGEPNVSHFENHVREWCGLFIFINHSQLFLIHQTAKEFLMTTTLLGHNPRTGLWKSSLLLDHVERELAIMCITFLRLSENARTSLVTDSAVGGAKSDFFCYSAMYWTSHLHDNDITEHPRLLNQVLDLYDTTNERFRKWYYIYWKDKYPTTDMPHRNDQHVISSFGHAKVLTVRYQRKKFDLNETATPSNVTALALAAEAGSEEAVRMLLYEGADPNIHGRYGTVLQSATFHGHADVVRTLLEWGVNVNTDLGFYGTAFDAARLIQRDDIAQMLLDNGAVGSPDDKVFGNALVTASKVAHTKIMRRLLDNRIDATISAEYFDKALAGAAANGHVRIVQMLLEGGVDTVMRKWDLDSAIDAALGGSHEQIVQMLCEFGAKQQ